MVNLAGWFTNHWQMCTFKKDCEEERGRRETESACEAENKWLMTRLWFTQTPLGKVVYGKWAHVCVGIQTCAWPCFCRCACVYPCLKVYKCVCVCVHLGVLTACKRYPVVRMSLNSGERWSKRGSYTGWSLSLQGCTLAHREGPALIYGHN